MILDILSPTAWVTLAGGLYVIGYLFINQVYLRIAMLFGSLAYIGYYWTAADLPLWGAILTSTSMIFANMIGLASLYARNASWSVPKENADIYPSFAPLQPGDFRSLVKRASRYVMEEDTIVTVQGEKPHKVYFVIDGTFQVNKGSAAFAVYGPTFVGEVAYLLGTPSAATTTIPAGVEVLEWSLSDLVKRSARQPRFKLALDAVISRDLARKVSLAVSPEAYLSAQSLGAPHENHA